MPAEWEPHDRTWMAFPPENDTFGDADSSSLAAARSAWTRVANVISRYEPVTLVANPSDAVIAASMLDAGVTVIEHPINDAWMRDSGPSFTVSGGRLGATRWIFNGWGGQPWARWDLDSELGGFVARHSGALERPSTLTNEGGGLHVDGAGTVLLTDTVQLDPHRNPGWTRAQVETEIHAQLGTSHAIWLPRGLTRDYDEYGTRGHVDIVATFVETGRVAAHVQRDPAHPDYEVTREIVAILRASADVAGRPLEVTEIPAPQVLEADGQWNDYSYLNHYVGNGFVLVGTFDDPNDEQALEILQHLYPGRRVETTDGRAIFAHGGGVHCITQQQPRP